MFKNMKIGKKLIVSFIAIVVIASIASLVGLALLTSVDNGYSEALVTNGFVQGDIGNFNTYLQKGAAMTRDVIMLTSKKEIEKARAELEKASTLANEALAKAKEHCKSPEEIKIIERIDAAAPKYTEFRDQAVQLGLANKNDEALKVFRDRAVPYLDECVDAGTELMELNIKVGNEVSTGLTNDANTGKLSIILVMLVATAAAIGLGIVVARSISRPVVACADRLKLLSEGDLHTEVPKATSADEVGVMLTSLQSTTDFMTTIIGEIDRGLGEMARGNFDIATDIEFKGDFDAVKNSIQTIIVSLSDTLGQINVASD
ncbi:MAG: MCP four helix bundle domain-containing protein, partial [Oscillospiraceae bacterium]